MRKPQQWDYLPDPANGLTDEFNQLAHQIARLASPIGPNEWEKITKSDFSFSFDYIVENHGSITIIDPTSEAALQWLYRFLPEDCPRWGKLGFAIETNYVGQILEAMSADGLKSESDYVEWMHQEQELQNGMANDADQGR